MTSEPEQYSHMPTAVMSDVLSGIKDQLVGYYSHLSDIAETQTARDDAWREVLAVRDREREVGPGDRAAMIELITRWGDRLRTLRGEG